MITIIANTFCEHYTEKPAMTAERLAGILFDCGFTHFNYIKVERNMATLRRQVAAELLKRHRVEEI